ncbi:hypothetical protein B0H19DRAFT_242998 [Mycena capillaripes]|nr:hypothetical protein B0H19DRAFT_242998 [Mycena capillaripes]
MKFESLPTWNFFEDKLIRANNPVGESVVESTRINTSLQVIPDLEPDKRGRGRPKGSRNKPKLENFAPRAQVKWPLMDMNRLVHRNIEVWLADNENYPIAHGEVKIHGNTITTPISLPQRMDYAVHWRNHPGTAHTVFCEIFVSGKKTPVATQFMDESMPETQYRSSIGRIDTIRSQDWLQAPAPSNQAYVELHIRRAKGNPIHNRVADPEDSDDYVDEIEMDLMDDPDEGQEPFIVFRFEFVSTPKTERNAVAGPSVSKSIGKVTGQVVLDSLSHA